MGRRYRPTAELGGEARRAAAPRGVKCALAEAAPSADWRAVTLAVAAALIPLVIRQRSHEGAAFIVDLSLDSRIVALPMQYLLGFDGPLEALATIAGIGLALLGLYLLLAKATADERRGARVVGRLAAIALGVPLALALAGVDYFLTRNGLASLVPVLIAFGAGFGARAAGRAGLAAAAALCAISLVMVVAVPTDSRYQRDDWRGAAEELGPARGARDRGLPASGSTALEHYLGPSRRLGFSGFPYSDVVVGMSARSTGESGEPPRPVTEPRLLEPRLELVSRRLADTFTVYRLHARHPSQYPGPILDELAHGGSRVVGPRC